MDAPGAPWPHNAGGGGGFGADSVGRVSSTPTASPNARPPLAARPPPLCSGRPLEKGGGLSAWTSMLAESPSGLPPPSLRSLVAVSPPPPALPEVRPELKDEAPDIISVDHEEKETISPVEVAKAYMRSRPPKRSLYTQSVRSKVLKEVASLPRVAHFETKLSFLSSTPSSTYLKFIDIGCPRSQDKSSPYKITCPYPGTSLVPLKFSDSYDGVPLASQWTPLKANHSIDKQVRKRRWSDLNGDLQRFCPVCGVCHNLNLTLPPREMKIQFSEKHLCSVFQKQNQDSLQQSSLWHEVCDTSVHDIEGRGEDIMSCANFASVPSQSSKIAKTIFQKLDHLISPKKKLSDQSCC